MTDTGRGSPRPGAQPTSCRQVLSDVTEDNLIDLGPGSPAVVSPTVGGVAPPSSLSSQLAGLGECPRPSPPAPTSPGPSLSSERPLTLESGPVLGSGVAAVLGMGRPPPQPGQGGRWVSAPWVPEMRASAAKAARGLEDGRPARAPANKVREPPCPLRAQTKAPPSRSSFSLKWVRDPRCHSHARWPRQARAGLLCVARFRG